MHPDDPSDPAPAPPPAVESPPPTPPPDMPDADEPRAVLNRLAHELSRSRNRKVLFEYLRLRRLIRTA